ncbi:BUD13 homolog [Anopheles bellator]|uniref:BUD13 homolog n=1 Tax=Anopheles bellator TaxID=139047 RepID=UPI002647D39D|nr:BUD13 homolog [Anopheles bellator]
MAQKINQKEYLKRYLSNDKEKKKKKKKVKKPIGKETVRIIDDDLDFAKLQTIENPDDVDLFALGEEAPQIVGIIDDRPPELRAKEDFSSNKWKVVAANDDTLQVRDVSNRTGDVRLAIGVETNAKQASTSSGGKARRDSDESPPRNRRSKDTRSKRLDSDESPPRRAVTSDTQMVRSRRDDSDESPPRRSKSDKTAPKRGNRHDSGESPPRRLRRDSDESPARRTKSDKSAPKRGNRHDSDESPPRRLRRDSDESLPRRPGSRDLHKSSSNGATRNKSSHRASHRHMDSDESPDRRNCGSNSRRDRGIARESPRRLVSSHRTDPVRRSSRRDSDESPPRRRGNDSRERSKSRRSPAGRNRQSTVEPAVRIKQEPRCDSDESPPRRGQKRSSRSPSRRTATILPPVRVKEERNRSPPEQEAAGPSRMTKTLDGKRVGLQAARAVREENERFRQREDELFSKMSADLTGRDAQTVVRGKTGRRKDIEKELREEFEKRKHEEKKKEIYTRWGKGVKQVEDYNARLQEAAHEMEKPLARYANDSDLDEHLKKQERIGDPMLEYLRSKRKEESQRAGIPEKPSYQGAYPDNRFNIRPGYRWDGVDRSNGFEKRWFDTMSKKKAVEEEAYKYSVEDM